ncbi:hypothetical protein B0H22_10371 [Methanohalophilus euhalobius]|uniref:Uncharacterized protein n=1 Tax=Methanohalophilus euhalobius TaxID=51203 RepID=A0A314ZPP0_9EURY|nr:hypothetical protein B0H22_10371 [Methanohalophilus euhalobius]RNI09366.1 hypothetical protein EDD83_05290 [Methanohalophilus euhalobius]
MFDKYFPHKEGLVQHINNWIQMFIAYHNYIRNHQKSSISKYIYAVSMGKMLLLNSAFVYSR